MTPPKFSVNDLVRFKMLSEVGQMHDAFWIDGSGNEIPEYCIGLIVLRHPSCEVLGWEYDIYVSVIEKISTNWGEFVLEPIA